MKTMIILRGLPGSGKSYLAKLLTRQHGIIHSTDDYYMVAGQYQYDRSRAQENHNKNVASALKSCEEGIALIVIDNTNIRKEHYQTYIDIAVGYGYRVSILIMGENDPDICFNRCTHGVPLEKIVAMKEAFEA